jgi:replicative DNA helicase
MTTSKRTPQDALLPCDVEAEAATLGSCTISGYAVENIAHFLRAEDFYREGNRIIYQAIVDLNAGGIPVDSVILCEELEKRGLLEDAGGRSYIWSLDNQVPTSVNIEHYARIVQRHSHLRQLIKIAGQLAALAHEKGADPMEVLTRHQTTLLKIEAGGGDTAFTDFAEILDQTKAEILDIMEAHHVPGIQSGIPDLDRHTGGFRPGEMVVICGRPGGFKSTVGLAFAVNEARRQAAIQRAWMLARRQRVEAARAKGEEGREELAAALAEKDPSGTIAIATLEMPSTQQAKRALASSAKLNTRRIRVGFRRADGTVDKADYATFDAAYAEHRNDIGKHLRMMDTPVSLSQLRMLAMREKREKNLQALFIDQFSLLAPEEEKGERGDEKRQRLEAYSRALKVLARSLNIVVVVLVQLNRESVKDARPTLAHLAGTDAVGQDMDWGFACHYAAGSRPELIDADWKFREFLELNVIKARDGEGAGVCIPLHVEPEFTRVTAWTYGGPESWPVDDTRKLVAPHGDNGYQEPADTGPSTEQKGFQDWGGFGSEYDA